MSSTWDSARQKQIPNVAALCSLGAKREPGGPPRSCLFSRQDSARRCSSSSVAKDFHLQLSHVPYLPIRGEILLVLGIWDLKNKSALENVLGSEWPVMNEFLPPLRSSKRRRCDGEFEASLREDAHSLPRKDECFILCDCARPLSWPCHLASTSAPWRRFGSPLFFAF